MPESEKFCGCKILQGNGLKGLLSGRGLGCVNIETFVADVYHQADFR